MPTRIVRDGILSSEPVCSLSWPEEVFYRRLMQVADDHGRYYALPKLLRAACYPLQIDKVSDSDIGKWLTALVEAALVRVYPASDGKRYVEIMKFGQRIQSKSKFPDPPEPTINPPCATVENRESPRPTVTNGLVVVEGVVEGVSTRKRARRVQTPMPDDFGISERVKAWAAEKGHTRLDEHFESFKAKCAAKGYTYADWDSAFMEAIRGDWAKVGTAQKPTGNHGGTSPAASRPL
jgi:hypothetical protein